MFDVFCLGSDLWLWKSPYCFNWIFHHPMQNIPKPEDRESILIIVKNDDSKVVGIQNIKWNERGQIIYKNRISYRNTRDYNFKSEGVSIKNLGTVEHEIIEIINSDDDDSFIRIERKYSQIRDIDFKDLLLDNDDIYCYFEKYNTNVYKYEYLYKNIKGQLENYRPIELELEDEIYIDDINEKAIEKIETTFRENGIVKRVNIVTPQAPYRGPYSDIRKGISSIDISYGYFSDKSCIPSTLSIWCTIDNLIYSYTFQEKVNFTFFTLHDYLFLKMGPDTSTVVLFDGHILVWKYYYKHNGRLDKMELIDVDNNSKEIFTIEYSDKL